MKRNWGFPATRRSHPVGATLLLLPPLMGREEGWGRGPPWSGRSAQSDRRPPCLPRPSHDAGLRYASHCVGGRRGGVAAHGGRVARLARSLGIALGPSTDGAVDHLSPARKNTVF
ncbi:hypothetical protein E2C01_082831 [Portunus trituberculatus]|uniref:Uncharacterized protein n=1 Tax=Portunus trituberculatus TaxID=210409 RepID=A0A5B7J4U8_PORTR|nr:hypothetical protein [Portunus trituberculatus]